VNEGDKKGNVEKWMLEIEKVMRRSLKMLTQQSIQDYYNAERTDWVKRWPGQVVLAVDQIDWTKGVEEVFSDMREGKMESYRDVINGQILEVVQMVRGKLSAQLRTTLKALVVLDVHGRQVVQDLIDQ
jgi:dynein heavy chain